MSSKTYKLTSIAALALAFGLILSSAVYAQKGSLNPKNIQGYNNLYADLDGDGHTERVVLKDATIEAGVTVPALTYRGQTIYNYQIIVLDDRGNTIWRTSTPYEWVTANSRNQKKSLGATVDPYYSMQTKHCLLHDIDGDGNIELVFSGWDDIFDHLRDGCAITYHPIFRWQNGKFIQLDDNMRLSTSKDSTICRFDTSYCDYVFHNEISPRTYKAPKYNETGRSLIHNLRKINGQVWGDILVDSSDEYMPMSLPKDVKYIKETLRHNDWYYRRYYWYKTVRLETCPGGMRIVEYKQFG